jgi:uroporphyrinogen decarboxylase
MNSKENILRAWSFQNPESIPIASGLPWLNWPEHGYDIKQLNSIMLRHKKLFPNFKEGYLEKNYYNLKERPDLIVGNKYKDGWGCVWETVCDGMVGAVTTHPLADISNLENYRLPDPAKTDGMFPIDWENLKKARRTASEKDDLFGLYFPHGHTFLRVQDLRGYENIIFDMSDDTPEFNQIMAMINEFNTQLVHRFIELKPDFIGIPEDLGMQSTPMLSPDMFKKYIKPVYMNMTMPAKEAGIIIHEHSDGFILPLIDDLVECGGDVINLQDIVNGIDNIAKQIKGRMAVDLDIDRQSVTVDGTAADIDAHIYEAVSKLGSKEGGLSLVYQPWPPTPAENMDAVFTAMEKYSDFFS